ncbi:MAG: ArsR family transcriptional regulator, partial [Nitrosopumilales archaeon]
MVTTKQLKNLIKILDVLKKRDMSITELQKEVDMKRSTLIYYLGILEEREWVSKEGQEKIQGKPVILKFNKDKYFKDAEKLDKQLKEDEERMLNHPLTFEILNLLKNDPTLSKKELHGLTTDYFRKSWHLTWLISKG